MWKFCLDSVLLLLQVLSQPLSALSAFSALLSLTVLFLKEFAVLFSKKSLWGSGGGEKNQLVRDERFRETELHILSSKDYIGIGRGPKNDGIFDRWWPSKFEDPKGCGPDTIKRPISGFCLGKLAKKTLGIGKANGKIPGSKYKLTDKRSEKKDPKGI